MSDLSDSLSTALAPGRRLDARLLDIVALSLRVSLSAVLLSGAAGVPLGDNWRSEVLAGRRTADGDRHMVSWACRR